jgi:hypothetical protein
MPNQNSISASWETEEARRLAMPITPTTETILSSGKKVRCPNYNFVESELTPNPHSVCQFSACGRNKEDHQDERNHEVRGTIGPVPGIWLIWFREDDKNWPQKNKDGRQELEIRLGGEHISFEV